MKHNYILALCLILFAAHIITPATSMTQRELNEQFLTAYRNKDFENMKKWLNHGADINSTTNPCHMQNPTDRTYLIEAILLQDPELVKFLLENGAYPNETHNAEHLTPLTYAISSPKNSKFEKILDLLVEHNAQLPNAAGIPDYLTQYDIGYITPEQRILIDQARTRVRARKRDKERFLQHQVSWNGMF